MTKELMLGQWVSTKDFNELAGASLQMGLMFALYVLLDGLGREPTPVEVHKFVVEGPESSPFKTVLRKCMEQGGEHIVELDFDDYKQGYKVDSKGLHIID